MAKSSSYIKVMLLIKIAHFSDFRAKYEYMAE